MTDTPEPLWPKEWGLYPDHCGDVLRGSYSVPFTPATPPVCLDIGANVGAFARWASKNWEGCTLHCYEPNPKVMEMLHQTIDTYTIAAETHQCAVSNKEGEATFSEGPNNCGEGSIVMQYGTPTFPVAVMDAAKLPRADVLKMDCEGCEWQILSRLKEVGRLFEFSAIMMETHNPSDRTQIMELLHANGFTLTKDHIWSRAGGIEYRDPQRTELCYVRADLVPAGFVPEVRDTSPGKPLVWIATPIRKSTSQGIITAEAFAALPAHYRDPIRAVGSAAHLPWRFEMCILGGGNIVRARNKIVQLFLASDAEYLIFQDFDVMPEPHHYVDLLAHMVQFKIRILGGCYVTRQKNGHWVFNLPAAEGIEYGFALVVGELGTAFKGYHRSVFEEVRAKNPWITNCMDEDTKEIYDAFFSIAPARDEAIWPGFNRVLTEDYWLDWLTRRCGIPTIWDTTIKLRHLDEETGIIYPLNDEWPPIPQRDQALLDAASHKLELAKVSNGSDLQKPAATSPA